MLFFKKKEPVNPDILIQEKWKTNFGMLSKTRFPVENQASYSSAKNNGRFSLNLKKRNVFAWVINPLYKYHDFCLEADIGFDAANPYSAQGFIFHYLNDENFYYFLISNKGYFRFDLVLNANPISFINWTRSPLITNQKNTLMIIANNNNYSFYIEDEWIAEMEDDTLVEGRIGFAAQNFDEGDKATFYMHQFAVDSRPVEVEKQFNRWTTYVPVMSENRIMLAKTLFAMGNFTTAAVQMKKVLKHRKPTVEDCLFFSETLLNLGINDVALEYIEKALVIDPNCREAIQEKANLLYLQNRFLESRDYIHTIITRIEDNAILYNLLGNSEYSLGNWAKAALAYLKASDLDPGMPLFLVNAARALEMDKQKHEALQNYIKASKLLFRQEAYADLQNILPRVSALNPENKGVKAFTAKMLFHEQKWEEAGVLIKELIAADYDDSAIYYLAGLLKADAGERADAIVFLEKACALEGDFYLNWYKLAENRFFLGQDPEKDLNRVAELAPEYPWGLNLFGLLYQQRGNLDKAIEYFNTACKLAPEELDILINLSEAMFRKGDKEAAFALIDNYGSEQARLYNHRGNLYGMSSQYEEAMHAYEKALRLEPDNLVYMENLASSCIELDMIMRAEELLVKLYDRNPTVDVLNLVGNLSLLKREFTRSEIAYNEALKLEPANTSVKANLVTLFITKQDYNKAREALATLVAAQAPSAQVDALVQRMRKTFETSYSCHTCDRVWWVPREVPMQSQLTLYAEPPGEAPAGKCPDCGKVYCIDCARAHLKEERFTCPVCGVFLKLSEDWIKYALLEALEKAAPVPESVTASPAENVQST